MAENVLSSLGTVGNTVRELETDRNRREHVPAPKLAEDNRKHCSGAGSTWGTQRTLLQSEG